MLLRECPPILALEVDDCIAVDPLLVDDVMKFGDKLPASKVWEDG